MLSSIFYGHNKHAFASLLHLGRGEDTAQNIGTKRRWGVTKQGQHCHLQEAMVRACVAPAREQQSWKCLPPLTQARSVSAPVPSTPHLAASVGCSTQHLLYRTRLVQNEKNGLGQEASPLQH